MCGRQPEQKRRSPCGPSACVQSPRDGCPQLLSQCLGTGKSPNEGKKWVKQCQEKSQGRWIEINWIKMKGVETLNALISFIAQIQYSGYGPFTYPVLLKIGILTWVCILSRFSNCPVHLRDDSFLCYKFLLHLFHLLLHLFHLPFQLKNYFLPMSSIPMRRPRILHT